MGSTPRAILKSGVVPGRDGVHGFGDLPVFLFGEVVAFGNEDKIYSPFPPTRNKNHRRLLECNSLRCNSASPVIRLLKEKEIATELSTE